MLEEKKICLNLHHYPAIQIKASYHSFGRWCSVAEEMTSCFTLRTFTIFSQHHFDLFQTIQIKRSSSQSEFLLPILVILSLAGHEKVFALSNVVEDCSVISFSVDAVSTLPTDLWFICFKVERLLCSPNKE